MIRTKEEDGIVILGAGPAGLGAALGLARRQRHPVLIEREARVGGNAGSFELAGIPVDYGSHRLHPTTDPDILETLRELLGPDLLERPRHGRMRLEGRWIHFPLRAFDLAFRAPPRFLFGAGRDAIRGLLSSAERTDDETFESVLLGGLGPTICRSFYFPYARKIWGLDPSEISSTQARKRVSANSPWRLLRRLLPQGGGEGGRRGGGTFLYPRHGFGQIADVLWEAATQAGAVTLLERTVRRVRVLEQGLEVEVGPSGGQGSPAAGAPDIQALSCRHLWSTIPLPVLVRLMDPPPPPEVLRSAGELKQRSMLLIYMVLEEDRFTEFDAHYFPSLDIPFTRVSEPKNYAGRAEPRGRTVLCVEIPCSPDDPVWTESAASVAGRVREGLARSGLPIRSRILESTIRRIPSAYPIYRRGFEDHLRRLEAWTAGIPGVVSFGRQGLFAHDNTHHALYMAQAAVRCLGADDRFDRSAWERYQQVFASHVVED